MANLSSMPSGFLTRRARLALWAAIAMLLCSCATAAKTDRGPALPRDENQRAAIAAIARADREVGTTPFVEERGTPRVLEPATLAPGDTPPDVGAIEHRHEFVVAMLGQDNPPFFWHDGSGRLTGLDVLLARDIALGLGVKLRINTSAKTFNEVVEEVRDRRADVGISKLSRTLGRAQAVAFSEPYVDLHRALLANRLALARYAPDRLLVPAIQNFNSRLGVIEKSSYEAYALDSFPHATLVRFPTWDGVVRAVREGTVIAGFRDELK